VKLTWGTGIVKLTWGTGIVKLTWGNGIDGTYITKVAAVA